MTPRTSLPSLSKTCNSCPEKPTFAFVGSEKGRPMDRSDRGDREESGILIPFSNAHRERLDLPVTFHRRELDQILRVYGRMVAAGEWRDYAIDHLRDRAMFSVYRRSSETPLFQIVKTPKLARKQGAFSVVTGIGAVLKRGHDLQRVLTVFDKQLKVVSA